jgi:hypothetical protein
MRDLLRKLARRLRTVVADCSYASRRLAELQTSMDGYLAEPDRAPGNYEEFLARTSGLLTHEPPAARRSARGALR